MLLLVEGALQAPPLVLLLCLTHTQLVSWHTPVSAFYFWTKVEQSVWGRGAVEEGAPVWRSASGPSLAQGCGLRALELSWCQHLPQGPAAAGRWAYECPSRAGCASWPTSRPRSGGSRAGGSPSSPALPPPRGCPGPAGSRGPRAPSPLCWSSDPGRPGLQPPAPPAPAPWCCCCHRSRRGHHRLWATSIASVSLGRGSGPAGGSLGPAHTLPQGLGWGTHASGQQEEEPSRSQKLWGEGGLCGCKGLPPPSGGWCIVRGWWSGGSRQHHESAHLSRPSTGLPLCHVSGSPPGEKRPERGGRRLLPHPLPGSPPLSRRSLLDTQSAPILSPPPRLQGKGVLLFLGAGGGQVALVERPTARHLAVPQFPSRKTSSSLPAVGKLAAKTGLTSRASRYKRGQRDPPFSHCLEEGHGQVFKTLPL